MGRIRKHIEVAVMGNYTYSRRGKTRYDPLSKRICGILKESRYK